MVEGPSTVLVEAGAHRLVELGFVLALVVFLVLVVSSGHLEILLGEVFMSNGLTPAGHFNVALPFESHYPK